MRIRSAALSIALVTMLLALAAASAPGAVLEADHACYGAGESIFLTGYGFTPNGDVALSAEGQQLGVAPADPEGTLGARVSVPSLAFGQIALRFTATDQTYLLERASASIRVTSTDVVVTPATGYPWRPRRIQARGFFGGRTLYAHVRRGSRTRNVRIGVLRGPCRTLDVTRRLFRANVTPGAYSLHFDTSRRFFRSAEAQITYRVTIARARPYAAEAGPRPASPAAATWARVAP